MLLIYYGLNKMDYLKWVIKLKNVHKMIFNNFQIKMDYK